jgi:uncharacterized protein YaaN involved in tellurite resistance
VKEKELTDTLVAPPIDEFSLSAPPPVTAPPMERVKAGLVPVDDSKKTELDARVGDFVDQLIKLDPKSPEFGAKAGTLTIIGQNEIRKLSSQSNRFLDRAVGSADGGVGMQLAELRRTVESLDPGERGNLLTKRKLFGLIPFGMGNKLTAYFDQYKSAQSHIAGILTALASGRETLLKDNIDIQTERANLWAQMGQLEQMIYVTKALDTALEDKSNELDGSDPAKAKAIREDALFEVRQRTTDLMTQMAVSVQGYLALDLIAKNNKELIKGVDRASTTTVSALRTAVTVAQALANQKLVLDQITALNSTTASIIDATGKLLKSQTAQIHEQAASATIPLDTLKMAFQNIYDTMDAIDTFKIKSLASMKTTVDSISGEIEKSKAYVARAEGARTGIATDGVAGLLGK